MKNLKFYVLVVLAVLTASVAAVSLLRNYENDILSDLKKEMTYEVPGEEDATQMAVDFSYLEKVNPDIVAWIDIPDSYISYPILQSGEDKKEDYYLHHNVDGTYGYPSSIYMQKTNDAGFDDPVTVLYGHNMKNGTMFAGLHNYENMAYFDTHPDIYVYTPAKTLHYQVFATVLFDDRLILDAYNGFQAGENVMAFYKESVSLADNVNYGVTVDEDSKILVLSTCEKGQSDKRYLLEAVLVD